MAITKYTDFCPACEKFETDGGRSDPKCYVCGCSWARVSDYWVALDEWEAIHKMKITDFRDMAVTDSRDYVSGGQLEKDLAVVVASARLDAATEIAHKILDIMEKEGHQNPKQALNQVAMNLGFIVADAHKDEIKAKEAAAE